MSFACRLEAMQDRSAFSECGVARGPIDKLTYSRGRSPGFDSRQALDGVCGLASAFRWMDLARAAPRASPFGGDELALIKAIGLRIESP